MFFLDLIPDRCIWPRAWGSVRDCIFGAGRFRGCGFRTASASDYLSSAGVFRQLRARNCVVMEKEVPALVTVDEMEQARWGAGRAVRAKESQDTGGLC